MNEAIAQNIRTLMRQKNLSILDIANIAELSRYQIDNIMYSRSKNMDIIKKIAQALEVSIDELCSSEFSLNPKNFKKNIIKNTEELSAEDYITIINCCKKLLEEYNVHLNKKNFERWVSTIHTYKKMVTSIVELKLVAKGILFYIIEYEEEKK